MTTSDQQHGNGAAQKGPGQDDKDPTAEASGATTGTAAEAAAEAAAAAMDPRDAEIVTLTAERDELRDRLLRALAEAENTRKRAERDRKDAEAFGGARLARDLLPVHDNLARALAMVEDSHREAFGPFIEGIELTQRELLGAFGRHAIAEVKPAIGDRFDPNLHQAMFEAPVAGAEPGTVIQLVNEGFTIAGRLLRAAQVGVAAKAPGGNGEG
jgi:molecular chaperone GrpE